MARVLVGVSGGIAVYKACELVRLLVKGGHEVVPLVTPGADRFVRAETFFALARRSPADDPYVHLTRADLLVIAPLTANTLAKLAHGLADNLVAEAALAHRGPVLLAPAMNPRMWAHPATQSNLETVRAHGAEIFGPDEGETAEGEWGVGRMAEPEEIYRRCRELLGESDSLAGRRVLVTAGGTREPLDAVRFLGNRSSGRMGVALAEEARRRGAEVTLLAANLAVAPPRGVEVIETPTAEALLEQALAHGEADVVLMAAAVADYRPAAVLEEKRPKDDKAWQVTLEPTVDVLRTLAERRTNGQVLIGFAADRGEGGLARAREKLTQKRVDLLVYNDVSRDDIGFDAEENEVVLVGPEGERRLEKAPKDQIAAKIVERAEELLRERTR
ncbi:MAG TPA: bifunctional phosphopantothenoylcysteine decarboxylase/phosphopantothenate--cysteine ligase CoaBC [Gaiellaceae bacterium]|nr:bifunctional phosphopantothenoylcysteine decarboxylase/phosphopantothenate--cysteine ligase CoaBC [Gaiellaceae bacterium]